MCSASQIKIGSLGRLASFSLGVSSDSSTLHIQTLLELCQINTGSREDNYCDTGILY
jgi:hypothetical protein